jgi:hypothetical protein
MRNVKQVQWFWTKVAVSVILGMTLLLLLMNRPASQEASYVCRNTGSRKGHRLRFGKQTDEWYNASALDEFMKANHPNELEYDWMTYSVTTRNIFGRGLSAGSGTPSPIFLVEPKLFDDYVRGLDDAKLQLYRTLKSGDEQAIREIVAEIREWDSKQVPTAP